MIINDYLPKMYDDNIEMQAIADSETIEFEKNLKSNIDNSFNNNFTSSMNLQGLERFEKILNIDPNEDTETVEFRKHRVINRLTTNIPFTERFLQIRLDEILGKDQWEYEIDYNNYYIHIRTLVPGNSWFIELMDFFNKIIPCNMEWELTLFAVNWQAIKDNFTWQSIIDSDLNWQELTNGTWL